MLAMTKAEAWLAGLVSLVLPACTGAHVARGEGYCAPPADVRWSVSADIAPANASREERLAALLGLRAALAERAKSEEARLRVVERIEMARLAIAATSAELDCEGERAQQAADALARSQSRGAQGLTIASIGVAAATSIVGVLLSTKNASAEAQDGVAIGGGAATAGLGLASLFVHPRLPFMHSRNLLADVWSGPATTPRYPPLVWAYLSRAEFSNSGQRSIREKMVERWKKDEELESDQALATLLFGGGGEYDADALRTRAAMLDEVKAEVSLANQDIAALAALLAPE